VLTKAIKLVCLGLASFFVMGFWWWLAKSPIEATVDKPSVETGEIFTYTITVEGTFKTPKLILPDFKKVGIVAQSQSRRYITVNSKRRLQTIIRFSLFARKPGTLKLGPAALEEGRRRYKTKPVVIKITGKPLDEKQKISPYIESGIRL